MKKIRQCTSEQVAKSWLTHFRKVAKTNRYAKGKEYDIIKTERVNSLGFTITDFKIIELCR
tara:strand:- start:896 stop:1078 length:183 start_codon:yes stop_codon:yes gene_type:complete